VTSAAVAEAAREHRQHVKYLIRELNQIKLAARHTVPRAIEKKVAQEAVWNKHLTPLSDAYARALAPNIDSTIQWAQSSWKTEKAAAPGSPNAEEMKKRLTHGVNDAALVQGGVQVYLGLTADTAVVAGQTALEHLGLNRTWAFASPREFAADHFSVRGSKIIQNMYGNHVDSLSKIITDATNPANPKTLGEVKRAINEQWPGMRAYQVDRIARTETATVWSSTSAAAYKANGITQFESTIAEGPSIGIESEEPCDECVDAAAEVHSMDDDLPPWHPNCRCEMVPVLQDENGDPWLPPDEPFTGGATGPDMPASIMPDVSDPAASSGEETITDGAATDHLDAQYADWGANLTPNELGGLQAYRSMRGFKLLNNWLRDGRIDGKTEPRPGEKRPPEWHANRAAIDTWIQGIDSAMEKAPEAGKNLDMTVFRGVQDLRGMFPDGTMVGDTFTDLGYTSTSTEIDTAYDYANSETGSIGGIIKIDVPANARGAWLRANPDLEAKIGPGGLSNYEYVLPRGSKFEVTKINKITADTPMSVPDVELRLIVPGAEPTAARAVEAISDANEVDKLVEATTWPSNDARMEARKAASSMMQGRDVRVIRAPDGTLEGISSTREFDGSLLVEHLASAKPGSGTALMRDVAARAAAKDQGVSLISLSDSSSAFYRKIGMREVKDNYKFEWSPQEAKDFASAEVPPASLEERNATGAVSKVVEIPGRISNVGSYEEKLAKVRRKARLR